MQIYFTNRSALCTRIHIVSVTKLMFGVGDVCVERHARTR